MLLKPDLINSLPNITNYPAQVDNSTDNYVEFFSSTEKAGTGKDGWLVEMANKFNNSKYTLSNGKQMSVKIRGIASGVGLDYIVSGKYLPDAFSPSNELWGKMAEASGVKIALVEKRLAGNVAGVLLSKAKQDQLIKKYGSINLKTIWISFAATASVIVFKLIDPYFLIN